MIWVYQVQYYEQEPVGSNIFIKISPKNTEI